MATVTGRIDAVTRHAAGEDVLATRQRVPQAQHGQQRKDGVREHRVGHRHIDVTATATAARIDDTGENADERGQRTAEEVADLKIRHRRSAAGQADLVEQAAVAEVVQIVAGAVPVRPVLPIAGDRAIHDARIELGNGLITDA